MLNYDVAYLIYDGADYSADRESRTWIRQYQILSSGANPPFGASGLPGKGSSHPSDSYAFLRSVKISRDGDTDRWVATCEYRAEETKDNQDPCRNGWEWSRDNWSKQVGLLTAKKVTNGVAASTKSPIVNSAGFKFSKAPEVDRKFATYRLSRCFRLDACPDPDDFQDRVNAAEIKLIDKVYQKNTLLVRDIRAQKVNEKVTVYDAAGTVVDEYTGYMKLDLDLAYNPDTWILKIVDVGLMHLDDDGKAYRIVDGAGGETATEWPLDGAGKMLSDARRTAGDLVFLEFLQYETADFSRLYLPEVK